MDAWEILNRVYEPLYQRVQRLGQQLAAAGYTARWSWYNLHASRRGDEYKVEFFPIPVITAGHWCDVILELDSICVDAHLTNEQARKFRWNRIPWAFEIYGVENYTEDLYSPGMSKEGLPDRIARYGGEIGVAFSMPNDCGDDEIVKIVDACREWDTHNGAPTT
ncbi:MAG: hypothetical protein K2O45_06915 [Oscillospiraceae bacterium]|nr:hypothetical protein [Oscillospiraceae bacterium]